MTDGKQGKEEVLRVIDLKYKVTYQVFPRLGIVTDSIKVQVFPSQPREVQDE
jgi:hypothetical protein